MCQGCVSLEVSWDVYSITDGLWYHPSFLKYVPNTLKRSLSQSLKARAVNSQTSTKQTSCVNTERSERKEVGRAPGGGNSKAVTMACPTIEHRRHSCETQLSQQRTNTNIKPVPANVASSARSTAETYYRPRLCCVQCMCKPSSV